MSATLSSLEVLRQSDGQVLLVHGSGGGGSGDFVNCEGVSAMLFDDIKLVVSEVDDSWLLESIDACERLDEMCRLYDELAPTPEMWAGAPEWAQWCVIHANGLQYFFDEA